MIPFSSGARPGAQIILIRNLARYFTGEAAGRNAAGR
jgi:hypothetical protein